MVLFSFSGLIRSVSVLSLLAFYFEDASEKRTAERNREHRHRRSEQARALLRTHSGAPAEELLLPPRCRARAVLCRLLAAAWRAGRPARLLVCLPGCLASGLG
mmetsp:Transcript_5863/g.12012  ORF Transcript_5863/g.12012 Transcript_5863/m.12012 type:complete len:103 (-) Transcript_5863:370-678(-)